MISAGDRFAIRDERGFLPVTIRGVDEFGAGVHSATLDGYARAGHALAVTVDELFPVAGAES